MQVTASCTDTLDSPCLDADGSKVNDATAGPLPPSSSVRTLQWMDGEQVDGQVGLPQVGMRLASERSEELQRYSRLEVDGLNRASSDIDRVDISDRAYQPYVRDRGTATSPSTGDYKDAADSKSTGCTGFLLGQTEWILQTVTIG
ncbi:hypothetical protein PO909_000229 [Leuciscus waleckii]